MDVNRFRGDGNLGFFRCGDFLEGVRIGFERSAKREML